MKIQIATMYPEVKLPSYAHPTDSGMDLHFYDPYMKEQAIFSNQTEILKTGIMISIPEMPAEQDFQWEIQIRPKSGLASKKKLIVLNTPGTVDQPYRGEIMVIMHNHDQHFHIIKQGQKIAQLVLAKSYRIQWELVDKLDETQRGAGGFGSTGA